MCQERKKVKKTYVISGFIVLCVVLLKCCIWLGLSCRLTIQCKVTTVARHGVSSERMCLSTEF